MGELSKTDDYDGHNQRKQKNLEEMEALCLLVFDIYKEYSWKHKYSTPLTFSS